MQFFLSSACFEHIIFIIRKPILRAALYGMLSMRLCRQSVRRKGVLDKMFETCRRQGLPWNINLKREFCWLTLHNRNVSQNPNIETQLGDFGVAEWRDVTWLSHWADVFEHSNTMNSTTFREFEILTAVMFGLLYFCNFFRLISDLIKKRPAAPTQCSVCAIKTAYNQYSWMCLAAAAPTGYS
jgi:hypothetical protein